MGLSKKQSIKFRFIYKPIVRATRADARRRLPIHLGFLISILKMSDYWLPDGRITTFWDSPKTCLQIGLMMVDGALRVAVKRALTNFLY